MRKFGGRLKSVGTALSVGITAPVVALGVKSVKSFDAQAKAVAQVEAGIKSTGGAAGRTSEQLQSMASALQGQSLFGDEEILKDVTAQLLTFTNIAGEQFDRTQKATLDLATRLDGDLKSAAIQLGKALNDPVANLSALSRSGIQFSNDQKKVIKSLVDTGRIADAQTVILNELEKQYGGAAEAAAKAGLGPFKQLSNAIGDLTEDFGEIIVEAIGPFIDKLKGIVESFSNLDASTKKTIAVIAGLAATIGPVLVTIGFLATNVIPGLIAAFTALKIAIASNPIGLLATAVASLIAVVAIANTRFGELTDATKEFSSLSESAAKNISKEKNELAKLLSVAKNESVSKEKRIEAINELNRIVPQYNGELSLETINTQKAKKATDEYIQSLLLKAKVQAAQEKLVQVEKNLLDLQLGQNNAVKPSLWQALGDGFSSLGDRKEFVAKTAQTIIENFEEEEKQLKSLQVQLTQFLDKNKEVADSIDLQSDSVKGLNNTLSANRNIQKEINNSIKAGAASMLEASTAIDSYKNSFNEVAVAGSKLAPVLTNAEKAAISIAATLNESIGPAIKEAAVTIVTGFGSIIAGFALGTAGMKDIANLILTTLGDLMIRLGEIAIQAAIGIAAIKAAFESINPAVAIAAGIALIAFGSLIKSAVQSAPADVALASGGVVTGETLALIGDNRNAAFDPEVVAPLSKLRDFINPNSGAQDIKIDLGTRVIKGTDIELVVNRVSSNKRRYS